VGILLRVTVPASGYTRCQRETVAAVYTLTSATAGQVAHLAAGGELTHPSGARLEPFSVPESTIRSIARRSRHKEAAALAATPLIGMPPRDAVERLRVRLLSATAAELDRIEVDQSEGRSVSGEALRQVARALRELSSIPGPDEPRPRPPGAKLNGVRDGSETRGGLAGLILAASRSS
jgi:hypothetical protein